MMSAAEPKGIPSAMELAALLTSKICHDLISPIGAINNGLEVLADEDSTDMHDFALDLIRKSAEQGASKLKFCRMAYGAGSAAGSEINLDIAYEVARDFLHSEKLTVEWNAPHEHMSKDKVKLLLNLMVLASAAIPRGGVMRVGVETEGPRFTLVSEGMNARIPTGVEDAMQGGIPDEGVDAHSIQNHFTYLVAKDASMKVDFAIDGEIVTITCS